MFVEVIPRKDVNESCFYLDSSLQTLWSIAKLAFIMTLEKQFPIVPNFWSVAYI